MSCNNSPSLEGVKTFNYDGGDHQEGSIDYEVALPAGGPHNPRWQNCGVYNGELHEEYAVHSLEHGAVWITYNTSLSKSDVLVLREAAAGRTHTLLSPRADQKAAVTLTAWNAQLELDKATDPRVQQFVQTYEQAGTAPEIGASCSGAYSETQ
jgi:hypothetical protein